MESVWADISLRIYDKDYIVFTSPCKIWCYDVTMTKTLHSKIYGLEMIAVVSIYLWLYWLWTFHDLDVKLYICSYLRCRFSWLEPHHDHQFLICSRNSLIIFRANHVFVSAMCKYFSQLAKHPNFAAGMKFCIFYVGI